MTASLLSILANLNNAVVWMVSILPLISNSIIIIIIVIAVVVVPAKSITDADYADDLALLAGSSSCVLIKQVLSPHEMARL